MNITRSLIVKYDVLTSELSSDNTQNDIIEITLSNLLTEFVDVICLNDYDPIREDISGNWFHKMFRQTDVITANIDKTIWLLLCNAPKFWELVDKQEII